MKRVEKSDNGTEVITKMIHLVNEDCYLLVQEIQSPSGLIESRSTITLSRSIIEEIHDYLDDQPSKSLETKQINCLECTTNSDPAIGGDPSLPIKVGTLKGIHKNLCVECVVCEDHNLLLEDPWCFVCKKVTSECDKRAKEIGFDECEWLASK